MGEQIMGNHPKDLFGIKKNRNFVAMNRKNFLISIIVCVTSAMSASEVSPNLPKVEILGKEYYYHEVKKGESIYGVSRQYDWDLDRLMELNPHVAREMKKGSRLYYPVEISASEGTNDVSNVEEIDNDAKPISHIVKKGETVYSISKQYKIPVEEIYASNPDSKYGIKTGQELILNQNPERQETKYLYYKVKPGDSLYTLARRHNVSVETLLRDNPGMTDSNLEEGETIRVDREESQKVRTTIVDEERLARIDTYKAKKNDSWESISKKTGVDKEKLQDANRTVAEPEKNTEIRIPVVETIKVEKEVIPEDPREKSVEGIRELYDSIHNIDSEVRLLDEVNVALLLDEPSSKKDVEFTRGVLLSLDEMKELPYKVNVKVIDGSNSTADVTETLDGFKPHLVIATADKSFPAFLADYGETNDVEIINAFDVKNDLYEENPSMIQLLPSSSYFNEAIIELIMGKYNDREMVIVGDENGDAILEILKEKYDSGKVIKMSVADLSDYTFDDNKRYLIYASGQKREEVHTVLNAVKDIRERAPFSDITILGRPSWVTMTDLFHTNYHEAEVIIPARCWIDTESGEGKTFSDKFEENFGQEPLKSYPNFAATGYDIAKYFIKATAETGGDYNRILPQGHGIQSDISLERNNNWSGFMNKSVYLLRFLPEGMIEKITLNN